MATTLYTFKVGKIPDDARQLRKVTKASLYAAINEARGRGIALGDVSPRRASMR